MLRCLCIFFTLLQLPLLIVAQPGKISGTVLDAVTKAPLAFVSIVIKGINKGVITDIDGHFTFDQLPGKASLMISYIGYKSKEVILDKTGFGTIQIFIERIESELENVIISANENPAHRIIKLLLKNKKRNDPESQPSFKYNAYTIAGLSSGNRFWNRNRAEPSKQKKQSIDKLVEKTRDTSGDKLGAVIARRFKENYLMLTESYTERIFRYPRQTKETVIATKVSGLNYHRLKTDGFDL